MAGVRVVVAENGETFVSYLRPAERARMFVG